MMRKLFDPLGLRKRRRFESLRGKINTVRVAMTIAILAIVVGIVCTVKCTLDKVEVHGGWKQAIITVGKEVKDIKEQINE